MFWRAFGGLLVVGAQSNAGSDGFAVGFMIGYMIGQLSAD